MAATVTTGFAPPPAPPYYPVIFSSRRNDRDEQGHDVMATRMFELVQQQPGFLRFESTRDAEGFGITVAYFDNEDNILAWRRHGEHADAHARGRSDWYQHFGVRVARVERACGAARIGHA
ncbi:MAG: antibiotic biosynthesis monooxygenase [Lysobacter sp.]|nr:antibiotic biosynthesis monooxygenase [Lysobacter sp.]